MYTHVLGTAAALLALALSPESRPKPEATINYPRVQNLVMLPVRVRGTTMRFALDSGADHTIIDRSTALRMSLRLRSEGVVGGAGKGSVALGHAGEQRVMIGAVSMIVPDLYALDFGDTPHAPQGLVGFDFFASHVVEIDSRDHVVNVYRPGGFAPDPHAVSVPLLVRNNQIFVALTVRSGGKRAVREAQIDTGSNDAVVDDMAADAPDAHRVLLGHGLGRNFYGTAGTLSSVVLGGFAVNSVPSASGPSRLGMGLLSKFTVTFDVPHRRLYLRAY